MDNEQTKDPAIRVVDRRWWARDEQSGTATAEEAAGRKPTFVEDLEQQLADARNRIQELTAGHRRALDEFEQVKLRIRRDVAREVERGKRAVLIELLEVVDNLDRAIAASRDVVPPTPAALDQLTRGVELVRDQFLGRLEGFGVVRVPALRAPFDAERHEAVTTSPVADAAQDGIVIAVIKEGYAIGEEILRPAAVVVGRYEKSEVES